ncbi:hypothetical protein [Aquihabitans sp. McL0605]|uniref:hypothetical protein n=1 Tax=Aquihabitans sp. McL0605 TaxID=3415671 RepID=UPI003CFA6870
MVEPGGRNRPRWSWIERVPAAAVVGALAVVLGYLTRVWVRASAGPLVWNDSADYLASAHTPLWSVDRLLGPRPILMPLVLSASHLSLEHLVEAHDAVAAVSWGLLAGVTAGCFRGGWRPVVAGGAVLVFSLTWPITMWDQQVLTESLALSTFALLAAAGVWFARHRTPARGAWLVVAATLWLVARDSHIIPVAAVGLGLVGAAVARFTGPRRTVVLTGGFLVAVAFLAAGSAQYGHRDRQPIEHVYVARVLPYPERVEWFAHHGMPEARALEALPEVVDPGGLHATYTPVDAAPAWDRWRAWLDRDGRRTLLAYTAAHPSYVWSEPEEQPERVFNNGVGLATYRPLDLHEVPWIATVFAPGVPLVAVVAAGAVTTLVVRRLPWTALATVGAVLALTSAPHALVVWHSDGMESARHLLVPTVQLRTGVLLLLLAALLGQRPREICPPSS